MNENETKYAIVINSQGYKVDTVLVEKISVTSEGESETGQTELQEIPYSYVLRDGERLIYSDFTVALSMIKPRWNGESWDETATPEEIEATLPPLENVRITKLTELGRACEAAIHAGVDVETTQGTEHFSLTINDQTNIANLAAQAQAGDTVLYHADGKLCRQFAPEEMLAVAAAAIAHKTYHTTLCNHYNVWARGAQTRDELTAIKYGFDLPEDLAANMSELLGKAV